MFLNAARFTQRKEPKSGEPSIAWKKKIIKAEHSPLRCLMFNIDFYDIPNYVSVHLVTTCSCSTIRKYLAPRH